MDTESVLSEIIKTANENFHVGESDFVNGEGLLVCGVCGKPKQMFLSFPGSEDKKIVPIICGCEEAQRAIQSEKQKTSENMAIVNSLRASSLMDAKFYEATFEHFECTKENSRNLKLCKRYATAFDKMLSNNQGLLMWGGVGTGKTFAASCIANYLLEQKVPVVMTSFIKLIEIIQKGDEEADRIINRLNRAKLLILDDLGAERSTEFALEKVYNIVDSRYRSNLPMIITANITLQEMKDESNIRLSRIYDRIFEVCYPMQFTGKSWRKKEASRRFDEMAKLFEDGE